MVAQTRYRPPEGPTQMWFIAHTGTLGCEHVVSIDFDRCLVTLPKIDTLLEPEFELLQMPLASDCAPTKVMARAIESPLRAITWLPVVAFPVPPQEPVRSTPAPPPSPVWAYQEPRAPPPSPGSSRRAPPAK